MICMVLAAGYATRLYPLTENFPKPLLKVGDKTILDWLLDDIEQSNEVSEYVVISNHKFAHHFDAWAKTKDYKVTVVDDGTESNETRLGAVRDVQFAIDKLGIADDILLIAGDNVLDFSLCKFIDYAKAKNTSAVMRYFEPDKAKLQKCGVLSLDGDVVTSMAEKPESPATNWCCPPFYFYKKCDLNINTAIADGCGYDAPGSYVAWLCTKTTVNAMEMPGSRYDIGNLKSYEQVKRDYKGINK